MFTRMAFNPTDGLKNKTAFVTTPASEDAARAQFQELLDQVKDQVNALMGALENSDSAASGARQIGSEAISGLEVGGVAPTTVWTQLVALSEKLNDAIAGDIEISDVIGVGDISGAMLADDAVTENKIADGSVSAGKIGDGQVGQDKLGTIQEITLDTGDTVSYDTVNNKIKLNVAGCTSVQLAPVVYGQSATPPAGTYPAGTIYIQYV